MNKYPICESIEVYIPKIDHENQCLRDLNRIELSDIYKEKGFTCCGTTFTHNKRSAFLHSHINTAKHKKFIDISTRKYKDEYGSFTNTQELANDLIKKNRDLKVQLHRKSDDCQKLEKRIR